MTHRITYVSSLDYKGRTRTFKTYAGAEKAWNTGIAEVNAYISYAVWHEAGVGIVAEKHRRLFNTAPVTTPVEVPASPISAPLAHRHERDDFQAALRAHEYAVETRAQRPGNDRSAENLARRRLLALYDTACDRSSNQ